MSGTTDTLTILTTFGPLLTKMVGPGPDGRLAVLKDYDNAEHFRSSTAIVHGLADMLAVLEHLATCPRSAIIRGAILPGTDSRRCKRLLRPMREDDGTITPATFQACPRRWLACDVDSVAPPVALPGLQWLERPADTAAFLAGRLPTEFRQASCVLQATSGAGIKPGIRARAWYWLDRPVSDAEAKRWLGAAPVDLSLFRAVQLHYTAAPVFRGCLDPLPQRLWLVPGEREVVPVSNLPEPPPRLVVPTRAPTPGAGSAYAHGCPETRVRCRSRCRERQPARQPQPRRLQPRPLHRVGRAGRHRGRLGPPVGCTPRRA
jgi:hypothetical protein